MPRVVGNIPNFLNGVSQQPAALRMESQAEEQVNCYSTVARGLVKRPGTEHVKELMSSAANNTWTHWINRDLQERYVILYDKTQTNTSPDLLTDAERILDTGWTSIGTMASQAHSATASDISDSPDGKTAFSRWTANAGDYSYLYPTFSHAGNTTYTFSIWVRRVSGTAVDLDILFQGADVTGTPVTTDITSTVNADTQWHKVEVSATTIASPVGTGGTGHFEVKLIENSAASLVLDVFAPQVEAAAASTMTRSIGQSVIPRLMVHDITGATEQVWIPDGESYLESATTEVEDLKAVTVADYSFISNNKVTVAEGSTTSPAEVYEAYVVFDTVQPGVDITVKINSDSHTVSVSDTDPTDLGTAKQAAAILTLMTDGAGTNFNTGDWTSEILGGGTGIGSVIYIKNATTDFTISARDDDNGEGVRVVKRQVQTFGELPRWGKQGSKIEVKGNADNDWSAFWVSFAGDDGDDGVATWEETVGPGVTLDFDDTTMPHILVREISDTFSFRQGDWAHQRVGDATTNGQPSFVNQKINDIFFTEGRLGILAGENIILGLSDPSGEGIFNFWRTSVTALLDGDPIDVATTHTKVAVLKHAVAYQEQLLLFSEQTQFRLTKGDVLSPKTVGIDVVTEFESSRVARPAPVGNFVFFVVEKSDYASVREYFVSDDNQNNDAREITAHIPQYITAGARFIKGTTNEDMVFVGNGTDLDTLFVYKYFWSGERKIQSSWSKWEFADCTAILGEPGFYGSKMYIVVKRADGVHLESVELDVGATDNSGTLYSWRMDRKVFSDNAGVSAVYDAGTDRTTYTFSEIVWKSVPRIVGSQGNTVAYPVGYEVPIVGSPTTYDANTIIVEGDSTAESFAFGIDIDSTYTISEIQVKAAAQNAKVPITEGKLQLQRFRVLFADTGYLKFDVTQVGRATTKTYVFTGRNAGEEENQVNAVPIEDGDMSIPLYSSNRKVTLTISSDSPLPFRLISADWTGLWYSKGKRI